MDVAVIDQLIREAVVDGVQGEIAECAAREWVVDEHGNRERIGFYLNRLCGPLIDSVVKELSIARGMIQREFVILQNKATILDWLNENEVEVTWRTFQGERSIRVKTKQGEYGHVDLELACEGAMSSESPKSNS